MSKDIRKKLDLSPSFIEKRREPIEDTDDDFELARNNIHDVIRTTREAIEELLEISKASEHPRAFEVLDKMLRTMSDVNKDLVDLHKKKVDLVKSIEENTPEKIENHNHLHITTAELNKLLENHSKSKEEDED